ncbi:hypothetical protein HELRODRAFT_160080 [Helobdella robusta]|uniref:Uncharacterized protein n=1 Tax=Helobdella robusta TaxID=6412 RepID=T1EPR2_HELRO|nr:hypothetical protein HELRODRAFT_160080 [Helobdella robusta]ESO05976.1 hypothetical protein HELRODRAFT_160080 [Helobdella robusta]
MSIDAQIRPPKKAGFWPGPNFGKICLSLDKQILNRIDNNNVEIIAEMKKFREKNKKIISEVKKSVQSLNVDVKNVQKTLMDVVDHRDREANLMMFKLSEGPDDKARVCKIIDHLTGVECSEKSILRMMRIGKKSDSTSLDRDLASARLSHDLSNDQRIELKKLLNEAKDMELWRLVNSVRFELLNVRSIGPSVNVIYGFMGLYVMTDEPEDVKNDCRKMLSDAVRRVLSSKILLIGDDLNSHVRKKTNEFCSVHGGFDHGDQNEDGVRILKFTEDHEF